MDIVPVSCRPFLLSLVLMLSACGSHTAGPVWGQDATLTPWSARLESALLAAATDPFTWLPAAAAGAVQIGGLDDEIAEWANEKTPIFGGRQAADEASDLLRATSLGIYVVAGLAAPVSAAEDPVRTKAKGFAVGAAATAVTAGAVRGLKEATDRERPLGQDDDSFPSGHASLAAVGARLTRDTLRYYELPPSARMATDAGLAGLAMMTGWGRVEAGEHHPADVLAAAELGNFVAVFATEAFLRGSARSVPSLNMAPAGDGWAVQATFAF